MPRLSNQKAKYKPKDFVKWLAGEMYDQKIKQQDIAIWLGTSQQMVSHKMAKASFTFVDMLTIFEKLGTEKEIQIKLMTI